MSCATRCAPTTPLDSGTIWGSFDPHASAHSRGLLNNSPLAPATNSQRRLLCLSPVLLGGPPGLRSSRQVGWTRGVLPGVWLGPLPLSQVVDGPLNLASGLLEAANSLRLPVAGICEKLREPDLVRSKRRSCAQSPINNSRLVRSSSLPSRGGGSGAGGATGTLGRGVNANHRFAAVCKQSLDHRHLSPYGFGIDVVDATRASCADHQNTVCHRYTMHNGMCMPVRTERQRHTAGLTNPSGAKKA